MESDLCKDCPAGDANDMRQCCKNSRLGAEKQIVTIWRPIATAPKDGKPFSTYTPGHEGSYDTAGWDDKIGDFWKDGCGFQYVTHWTRFEDGYEPTIGICENCFKPFASGNVVLIYDDIWMHGDCDHPYRLEVRPAENTPPASILLGEQEMIYPLPPVLQKALGEADDTLAKLSASLTEWDTELFAKEIAVIAQERADIAAINKPARPAEK